MKSRLRSAPYLCLAALVITTVLRGEVSQNMKLPINIATTIACGGGPGEVITLEGYLHVTVSFTTNAQSTHLRTSANAQGVSGTGDVSGTRYQGTGVTRGSFSSDGEAAYPWRQTFVNNFRLIGQGQANNVLIHQNVNIVVSANGAFTGWADNFRSECK